MAVFVGTPLCVLAVLFGDSAAVLFPLLFVGETIVFLHIGPINSVVLSIVDVRLPSRVRDIFYLIDRLRLVSDESKSSCNGGFDISAAFIGKNAFFKLVPKTKICFIFSGV